MPLRLLNRSRVAFAVTGYAAEREAKAKDDAKKTTDKTGGRRDTEARPRSRVNLIGIATSEIVGGAGSVRSVLGQCDWQRC